MMEDTLTKFSEQFDWIPRVENQEQLGRHAFFKIVGMGGSHLGGWLLQQYSGLFNITIHRDYGLPACPDGTLVILTSYSGNTEEILDAARVAFARKIPTAIIASGGKLLAFAREHYLPHIQIPEMGLEPRMATGLLMIATARLMSNSVLEDNIRAAGKAISPAANKPEAEKLAEKLRGKIPVLYSSASNESLSYIWKINLNETSKIPAFWNEFPELCHNEISGYDVVDSTRPLSAQLAPVFLADYTDHPRVQKRMQILKEILTEKGIPVYEQHLLGMGFEKAFRSVLFSNWVSMFLAQYYGVPNPETPLIADFKRRMEK